MASYVRSILSHFFEQSKFHNNLPIRYVIEIIVKNIKLFYLKILDDLESICNLNLQH